MRRADDAPAMSGGVQVHTPHLARPRRVNKPLRRRSDFESNCQRDRRFLLLSCLYRLAHALFGKPVPTFPGHALRVVSGDTMRQSISYLAAIAVIAISCRPAISRAAIVEWPRVLKKPALAPIDAFVDWLEAAYGGPIGSDE